MRETDEQMGEWVRSEFTDMALEQFREACAARAAVPAALVALSPDPEGRWMLHVATIRDGPVEEVEVLRGLSMHLADLIREVRAQKRKEKGGGR